MNKNVINQLYPNLQISEHHEVWLVVEQAIISHISYHEILNEALFLNSFLYFTVLNVFQRVAATVCVKQFVFTF